MYKFNRAQIESLKEYLYHSYIHDAKIEVVSYDREKKNLIIKAINPIYNNRINLTFEEVKAVLSISGNEPGSYETIISLTAEEDYSYFQNCTKVYNDRFFDTLYILIQTFSGDELHIISKNIIIESMR